MIHHHQSLAGWACWVNAPHVGDMLSVRDGMDGIKAAPCGRQNDDSNVKPIFLKCATTKSWRSIWTRTAYTAHCHRCAAPGHHAGPPGSTWMLPLQDLGPNAATTDPQSHRSHGQDPTCWLGKPVKTLDEAPWQWKPWTKHLGLYDQDPSDVQMDFLTLHILDFMMVRYGVDSRIWSKRWHHQHMQCLLSIQPWHMLYWTTGYRQPMPTRCGKNTAAPWATLPASSRPLGIRLCSGVIKSALDFAGLTLMDFHHHAAKKHTDWQRNFECVGAGLSPTAFKIMGCPDSLQHVRNCGAGASLSTLVNLWFHPLP